MHSLTSVLDGGEWSASRSSNFTSGIHWMGPRADLNQVWNRKILAAAGNRTPAVQNEAYLGSFRYGSSLVTSSRTSKCRLLLVQAKHRHRRETQTRVPIDYILSSTNVEHST
jgi:hypothetical protein